MVRSNSGFASTKFSLETVKKVLKKILIHFFENVYLKKGIYFTKDAPGYARYLKSRGGLAFIQNIINFILLN